MAYQVFDYQGTLLGEEEDSVVENRLLNGDTENDGLTYYQYDVYDSGEIYNTFSSIDSPSGIRVVKKIEVDA